MLLGRCYGINKKWLEVQRNLGMCIRSKTHSAGGTQWVSLSQSVFLQHSLSCSRFHHQWFPVSQMYIYSWLKVAEQVIKELISHWDKPTATLFHLTSQPFISQPMPNASSHCHLFEDFRFCCRFKHQEAQGCSGRHSTILPPFWRDFTTGCIFPFHFLSAFCRDQALHFHSHHS